MADRADSAVAVLLHPFASSRRRERSFLESFSGRSCQGEADGRVALTQKYQITKSQGLSVADIKTSVPDDQIEHFVIQTSEIEFFQRLTISRE
jgi:hypothetical protein